MSLTTIECDRAVCPPGKSRVRLADGHGMYLEVTAAGGKYWRMKYRHGGKEKRLKIYPPTAVLDMKLAPGEISSDGGRLIDVLLARRHVAPDRLYAALHRLSGVNASADVFIDRLEPVADRSMAEELTRVLPVIRHLATRIGAPISIDTVKASVARAAVEAGAVALDVMPPHHWLRFGFTPGHALQYFEAIHQAAPNADLVWCQEEPMNQGAWYSSQHHMRHAVQELYGRDMYLDYVGREASAAPAGGYMSAHIEEEKRFVNKALTV